jgi:hypothetical protein
MAELRPKIVKLCKVVGGLTGMVNKIDADAPEYYCLAGILTDDEADVAIAAGLRHERTAEYLAKKTGRTLEETQCKDRRASGLDRHFPHHHRPRGRQGHASSCRSSPPASWR